MEKKPQFDSLTALKGLFIFVIVFHNSLVTNTFFDSVPGTSFIRLFGGKFGDTVFFMLSGFLFSYSYYERIHEKAISFNSFFLRRLNKLFPLYILSNLAALVLEIIRHGMSVISIERIVFTALLQIGGGLQSGVPYNCPSWFVSALFVCYIAFYFICSLTKNKSQYIACILAGIVWGYTLMHTNLSIPFCFPKSGLAYINFFIGCGLNELFPLIPKKYYAKLQISGFAILVACFYGFLRYGVVIIAGDFLVACAFLLSPIILFLAISEGWISRLLQLKPLVFIGKVSISIFFWHMIVYDAFVLLIGKEQFTEVHYLLYPFILLLFSIGSYYLIEQRKRKAGSLL